MNAMRPARRARISRLLHLIASAAIVTVLALTPPAMPDFGASLATPLTTSTLIRLALVLLWIVCLMLALALLQRALHPARPLLRPPAWTTRTTSRKHRARQLTRRDAPPAARLVVPPRDLESPPAVVSPGDRSDDAEMTPAYSVATVCLLGPVMITGARRPRRAATVELLAYLALHRGGASIDELLEAMWPRQDPRRTRPRLWQAASEARRLLGDAFERHGDRYALDRNRVQTDVDQLEQLLTGLKRASPADAASLAERALALWRAEPMSGTDYTWAEGHVRQLQATLSNLAVMTARLCLDAGDAPGALHVAEHGLAIDDLNENFVRIALEAEAALGHRGAITGRYEALSRRLDVQLGVEPERSTRILYLKLLGQEASELPAGASRGAHGVRAPDSLSRS